MNNDELKVMPIVSRSSGQRSNQEIYEEAKKNSCGVKSKKAIQRRKKELERKKKIKKMLAIVLAGGVVLGVSIGLGVNAYQNYQNNLPENKLASTVDVMSDSFENLEEAMSQLEDNVYKNLSKNSTVIYGCQKNTADNKNFYYDFKGVEERFSVKATNTLEDYGLSPEQASEFWGNLTEEERDAIMINVCVDKIEVYEGGQDSLGNFILRVVDLEGYNRYKENHEQFFQEMEEMAKSGTGKLAQMLLEQELGYSLDGYLNNAENGRGGRQ